MATSTEVRNLIEQAAQLARGGDYDAAVERARRALHEARDEDVRQEASLALAQHLEEERAWLAEIEARRKGYVDRELTEEGVPPEASASEPARRSSWLSRLRARLSRRHAIA